MKQAKIYCKNRYKNYNIILLSRISIITSPTNIDNFCNKFRIVQNRDNVILSNSCSALDS